jgi:protein TonB
MARATAVVELDVEIAPDGHVSNAVVLNGHPLFNKAAEEAVRQWVYQPTMVGGQAIPVVTTVTINFQLQN